MREWDVPGYTELKALGSGGFGDVVLARHDASGTLVAIKYLRADLLADPEFAQMFRVEATALAAVTDANVVRLYEYVEAPSGAAIVMELVDGVSLREILARQGKTNAEAALVVLRGSLFGLAAAHRRGVVHRDYKPENVLIDGVGASKLTDFGIAARAGDQPIPAGTLAYAAPEQMTGGPATPASDVYAATATFYECLTGHPPFRAETAEALLRQHRSEPVPLDPVPEPLRPLVAAGMAKDPAARPADASTLVGQLTAIASAAYGRDWAERGRSYLGEAALLLALLWPSGAPPAVTGITVERIPLHQRLRPPRNRRIQDHQPGDRRIRRRRLGPGRAAIAVSIAIFIVATGTALAGAGGSSAGSAGSGGPARPVAVVRQVPLVDVTIRAVSALPPVTGDVYVRYQSGQDTDAQISGTIQPAASGEVARLYAQPFPYTSGLASVASVPLNPAGGTADYTFTVTPTLATRYQVELFRSSTATTPLGRSASQMLYVASSRTATVTSGGSCSPPTCQAAVTETILVPPSALQAELVKQWFWYFAVNLAATSQAPRPTLLRLGADDPVSTTPARVSADEFKISVTFTFDYSAGSSWHWVAQGCTKDTEAQDGIGLPGSHGCGNATIPSPDPYLG
jgi:eukaryotic-like serine/threonine-protein kinase